MLSRAPLVSVVVPAYNHEKFIGACLQSVLDQTYQNFELIIVNDGSTDRTEEAILAVHDRRIQYVLQENQDAYTAINRGIDIASGEYIAILNSDDLFLPTRLQKSVSALNEKLMLDFVSGPLLYIDEHDRPVQESDSRLGWYRRAYAFYEKNSESFITSLLHGNFLITTSNFFFRKYFFTKTGVFRPLRYAHDLDFLVRATAGSTLGMLGEPLVKYRLHRQNTIAENAREVAFEFSWILADHLFRSKAGDLEIARLAGIAQENIPPDWHLLLEYRRSLSSLEAESAEKNYLDILLDKNNRLRQLVFREARENTICQ